MKKPLQKDIYREMKLGKKELTITSIVILLVSITIMGAGVFLIIRGALSPNGAWQIIWRVMLGVISIILGGILLGVGITMFAVTRSMINVDQEIGNIAKGTNFTCEKCGTKLSNDAKFCKECGEPVELTMCETCGKPIPKDAKFCKECGKGVKIKEKWKDYLQDFNLPELFI